MAKEEDLTYSDPKPVETPKKKKLSVWWFVLAAVIIIALFIVKGNYTDINNALNPSQPIVVPSAADVQLYKFDTLSSNKSANIEFWIINLGENTSTNLSVHVRVRTENGTILFDDDVHLSSLILRGNETCTGDYTVKYKTRPTTLYSTLELSWESGRRTYSKVTP